MKSGVTPAACCSASLSCSWVVATAAPRCSVRWITSRPIGPTGAALGYAQSGGLIVALGLLVDDAELAGDEVDGPAARPLGHRTGVHDVGEQRGDVRRPSSARRSVVVSQGDDGRDRLAVDDDEVADRTGIDQIASSGLDRCVERCRRRDDEARHGGALAFADDRKLKREEHETEMVAAN